ncbi:integrase [Gossypium australe]|uniref:Integrase n=1 Tax=Gossypium australe TaxID=47621 RepID=A0A5B6UZL9_9ROSI|nr:integrase [Gossypium australe]
MMKSNDSEFQIGIDGCLLFRGRVCAPKNSELVQKILHEAHSDIMSVHPGSNKMYNDLKKMYWWPGQRRTSGTLGITPANYYTGMEMGKNYYGFCVGITIATEEERCHLGDR